MPLFILSFDTVGYINGTYGTVHNHKQIFPSCSQMSCDNPRNLFSVCLFLHISCYSSIVIIITFLLCLPFISVESLLNMTLIRFISMYCLFISYRCYCLTSLPACCHKLSGILLVTWVQSSFSAVPNYLCPISLYY